MCGIFGWITRSDRRPEMGELRRLTDMLSHRGPDGGGYELLETADSRYSIGLGHRRLSIIDLSDAGAQPMWSSDRRFCLIFNGEIYNYIELRAELAALNHQFFSSSDSEVLIESVRAWGKGAISRFRGMFSFALYDQQNQSVFFARDAFGKKPLLLGRRGEDLFFSSEIEPITCVPGFQRSFDWGALDGYLLDRYVPGPSTFFKNITKLPPGHTALWENGCMTVERYYTPPLATTVPDLKNLEEGVQLFAKTFDEAVQIRMRSDAPFGAFLSGGLDSTAIVGSMQKYSNHRIKTFSIGFKEEEYSELRYCNLVAKKFGTEHNDFIVTSDNFFDDWEDAIRHRGAPVSEASDIPFMILSRQARSSVKMVLTGEGADEFLAGYPKHVAECYTANYQGIVPSRLHQGAINPAINWLPYGMRRIKVLAKALGERNPRHRVRLWFGGVSQAERQELLGHKSMGESFDDFPFSIKTNSNLRRTQFFDQTSWLPDNSLERADRMMMAGSIEGRMPFMDTELAAVVARMPDSFLVRFGRGKLVLRLASRGEIPDEIIRRRKNGFRVPVNEWFRRKYSGLVRDLLTSKQSITRQLLNSAYIERLVNDHVQGRVNNERILWSLCNLEQFFKVYKPDFGTSFEG